MIRAETKTLHNAIAHHATAQSYRTIYEHFRLFEDKHRLLLGVTATPNRADGIGLGKIFQEIVDDKDILYGINNGWLVDVRGIRIRTGVNLNRVHNRAGDFDLAELVLLGHKIMANSSP